MNLCPCVCRYRLVMITLEAAFCMVTIVKEQTQHHFIFEAVLQRCGKYSVTDDREGAVDVRPIGEKQPHQLVFPSSDCHQEAAQRVQVWICTRFQKYLGAGDVSIADGEVQWGLPHVTVLFGNMAAQDWVDVKAFFDEQLETVSMTSVRRRMNRTHTGQTDGPLSGDGNEGPQSPVRLKRDTMILSWQRCCSVVRLIWHALTGSALRRLHGELAVESKNWLH